MVLTPNIHRIVGVSGLRFGCFELLVCVSLLGRFVFCSGSTHRPLSNSFFGLYLEI